MWHVLSLLAVVIAVLVFASPCRGQVIPLRSLTVRAVERRADMLKARAQTAAALAEADLAKSEYLPHASVELEGAAAPGGKLVRVLDTEGQEYLVQGSREFGEDEAFLPQLRYGGVLAVRGRLYDFGRTGAYVAAATARADAARAGERATNAAIVREVEAAYLRWILAFEADALTRREAVAARERRETIESAVAAGEKPSADLAAARYHESRAELERSRARTRLDAAVVELSLAVGESLPASAEPDRTLLDLVDAPSMRSPESVELEAIVAKRAASLATARAHERGHGAALVGGVEAGARGQGDRLFPAYEVGISLSLPLFDGGSSDARARAARAEATQLDAEVRERTFALETRSVLARVDLASAKQRVAIATSLVEAALRREQDAEARYRLGEATLADVMAVRNERLHAEQELLRAKVDRVEASFRMRDPALPARGR